MIVEIRLSIECGKERCVVGNKRCRFLAASVVRDTMHCRIFDEVIYNYKDKDIFPGKQLHRCTACMNAVVKKEA